MNVTSAGTYTIALEELWGVLAAHQLWLFGEKGGKRADLSRLRLEGVSLRGVNLSRAKLVGAKIINCDFAGAQLEGADLYGVDLTGTNLTATNCLRADLRGAQLKGSDFTGAELSGADLRSGAPDVGWRRDGILCGKRSRGGAASASGQSRRRAAERRHDPQGRPHPCQHAQRQAGRRGSDRHDDEGRGPDRRRSVPLRPHRCAPRSGQRRRRQAGRRGAERRQSDRRRSVDPWRSANADVSESVRVDDSAEAWTKLQEKIVSHTALGRDRRCLGFARGIRPRRSFRPRSLGLEPGRRGVPGSAAARDQADRGLAQSLQLRPFGP